MCEDEDDITYHSLRIPNDVTVLDDVIGREGRRR